MFNFSLSALSDHVVADNEISLRIYNDLVDKYNKSTHLYPKEINIFGVYFIDVLKLLTNTYLKAKEINLEILPNNQYVTSKLDRWPYISYDDISNGCDVDSKIFGKGSSVSQSQLKVLSHFVVNMQYFLGRRFSKRLSLISPRIDSGSNILWFQDPRTSGLRTSGSGAHKGKNEPKFQK